MLTHQVQTFDLFTIHASLHHSPFNLLLSALKVAQCLCAEAMGRVAGPQAAKLRPLPGRSVSTFSFDSASPPETAALSASAPAAATAAAAEPTDAVKNTGKTAKHTGKSASKLSTQSAERPISQAERQPSITCSHEPLRTGSIGVSSEPVKATDISTAAGVCTANPPTLVLETAPAAAESSLSLSTAAMVSQASSSPPPRHLHLEAPPTNQPSVGVQGANEGLQSASIMHSRDTVADHAPVKSSQTPNASSPSSSQHPSGWPELHNIPASVPTVCCSSEETLHDSRQTAAALLNTMLPTGAVFDITDKATVAADIPTTLTASQAALNAAALAAASLTEGTLAGGPVVSLQNPNSALSVESRAADCSQTDPNYAEATMHQASTLEAQDTKLALASHPQYIYAGLPPSVTTPPRASISPANALRTELALTAQSAFLPSSTQTVNTEPLSPAEMLRMLVCKNTSHTASAGVVQSQMQMTPVSTSVAQVSGACSAYRQAQVAPSHPLQTQSTSPAQQSPPQQAALALSNNSDAAATRPDTVQSQPMTHVSQQPQADSFAAGQTAGDEAAAQELADVVPEISAAAAARAAAAAELAEPRHVPVRPEPVCMRFNLLGPSMLPMQQAATCALSLPVHSGAGMPHVRSLTYCWCSAESL